MASPATCPMASGADLCGQRLSSTTAVPAAVRNTTISREKAVRANGVDATSLLQAIANQALRTNSTMAARLTWLADFAPMKSAIGTIDKSNNTDLGRQTSPSE